MAKKKGFFKTKQEYLVVLRDEKTGEPRVERVATKEEADKHEKLAFLPPYEGLLRQLHLIPPEFVPLMVKKRMERFNPGLLQKWLDQQRVLVVPSSKNLFKWFVLQQQGNTSEHFSSYLAAISGSDNLSLDNVEREA